MNNPILHRIAVIIGTLLLGATLLHPLFRPYLVFFLLNGLVLVNAAIIYANLRKSSSWTDTILGVAVIHFTQVTVTLFYIGITGHFTFRNVVLAQIGCLGLTLFAVWTGRMRLPAVRTVRTSMSFLFKAITGVITECYATVLACAVAGCAFVFVFAVSALNPPISIDAIFFHMNLPVQWIQTGHIPIQSEQHFPYPHGIGLLTAWLLFPFHHDFIARLSQTPVVLLGCLACYGICRNLDMTRRLAFITALGVLTIPAYLAGGITLTDPDTLMAGTFLVSMYFATSLARWYHYGAVVLLALSLGLLLNTKYNALYYGFPLICLVIYAWNKGRHTVHQPGLSFFHGVLLLAVPLVIGGVPYLHFLYARHIPSPFGGLIYGFSPTSVFNPSVRTFSLLLFAASPESLHSTGLSVLVGLCVLYGFFRLIRAGRWREMILPGFICLSVVFSLAVYTLFGYYKGALAIRHLLGTLALCVVLAGWTAHQMGERGRRYGTWGLVILVVISSALGFLRQWPVHRTTTSMMAAGIALIVGIGLWWAFSTIRREGVVHPLLRLRMPVAAWLFIAWAGLLGLHGWEFVYRDYKYARWPPWYGFGTGWTHAANATADHGARIAANTIPYPLFGYDMKNRIFQYIPAIKRDDSPEQRIQRLKDWERLLIHEHIDYVYILVIGGRTEQTDITEEERYDLVDEWTKSRPERFTLVFKSGRELLYRLTVPSSG